MKSVTSKERTAVDLCLSKGLHFQQHVSNFELKALTYLNLKECLVRGLESQIGALYYTKSALEMYPLQVPFVLSL